MSSGKAYRLNIRKCLRIGDMNAVPCQQQINAVNSRHGNMCCIANGFRRQNLRFENVFHKGNNGLVYCKQWKLFDGRKSFPSGFPVAIRSLIQDNLGNHDTKIVSSAFPPLTSNFLSSRYNQIAAGTAR